MTNTKCILLIAVALLMPTIAHAQLVFDVQNDKTGLQPIAVVPFSANDGLQTDVAGIIEADLNRSGQFKTLPRGDMLEKPDDPSKVDFRNWRAVAMDNLVVGKLIRDPGGDRVGARFSLLDTVRGQQLIAYDMPAVAPDQLRYIAHQIADLIYERLTGVPGIFSTKIAYVASTGIGPSTNYQLLVADADGYNPRVIASSRETLMSPAWSPDRKQLAYVGFERGHQSIWVEELATGKIRKIISEKGINGAPAWSPDGRSMLVTLSYETNPDIYLIDLQSGQKKRLTDHYGIDTEASFSPDGQTIVFTSDRGGQPQIYKVPVTGGDAQRVTFEGRKNMDATFSPDGKSLALVNVGDCGYCIAILDLASGNMRTVSTGGQDESPSFAPNGAVIIYATQVKGHGAELATVTTDGRVRQQLHQPGDVKEPSWSPFAK